MRPPVVCFIRVISYLHQTEVAVHREAPEGFGGRALLDKAPQGGTSVCGELLQQVLGLNLKQKFLCVSLKR